MHPDEIIRGIASYTKNQPNNINAWRLGEIAAKTMAELNCGDTIDRGLILMRELEAKGYGIVSLGTSMPAPQESDPVVALVLAELERATRKFPTWPTDPLHASGVVMEESGELAKAVLQAVYEPHKSTIEDVRTEAIQTAAMAIRFLKSMYIYSWAKGEQHSQADHAASGGC